MTNDVCPCVKNHSPKPAYLQDHHIVPKSWGGSNAKENRILLCGTVHDATHDLMNLIVRKNRAGLPIHASDMRTYPKLAQKLATQAVVWFESHNNAKPGVLTRGGTTEMTETDPHDD